MAQGCPNEFPACALLQRDSNGNLLPRMHVSADDGSSGAGLTAEDCDFFKKNGYLVKRKLLEPNRLQHCVDKLWAAAPACIQRRRPESWVDPARHAQWATQPVHGYERLDHNRSGNRWTLHVLGTDREFLRATAHHPIALRLAESILGGPLKLPGRNRGIYAIFPTSKNSALGPHVDSHTFQLQMVTYLNTVGPSSGGFTVWPQSHKLVYYAHKEALNWYPTDEFPQVIDKVKSTIQPVQMVGEIGDCIFTHHRIVHSAGSNTGSRIRMGAFTDYQKVRPQGPIVWRVNGRETQSDGSFSRYGLGGGAALEGIPGSDGEPVRYSVPWWDDNLEVAPTDPPEEDMWADWNLGSKPATGNIINTRDWRPPVPTPIYSRPPPRGSQPQAPLPVW